MTEKKRKPKKGLKNLSIVLAMLIVIFAGFTPFPRRTRPLNRSPLHFANNFSGLTGHTETESLYMSERYKNSRLPVQSPVAGSFSYL